jgi:hypothetical protein
MCVEDTDMPWESAFMVRFRHSYSSALGEKLCGVVVKAKDLCRPRRDNGRHRHRVSTFFLAESTCRREDLHI